MPRWRRCLSPLFVVVAACGGDSDVQRLDEYEVVVSDDSMSLVVSTDSCGEIRVSTAETDQEVRLTVMQITPGQGDSCAGAISEPVSLIQPLEDRVIVDDSSGELITPS
jgi:hypothetical protein